MAERSISDGRSLIVEAKARLKRHPAASDPNTDQNELVWPESDPTTVSLEVGGRNIPARYLSVSPPKLILPGRPKDDEELSKLVSAGLDSVIDFSPMHLERDSATAFESETFGDVDSNPFVMEFNQESFAGHKEILTITAEAPPGTRKNQFLKYDTIHFDVTVRAVRHQEFVRIIGQGTLKKGLELFSKRVSRFVNYPIPMRPTVVQFENSEFPN